MALRKAKTLPNGTTGEYWKITKEHYDRITHIATWSIALFVDRDCGISGAHLGPIKTYWKELTSQESHGDRTAIGYAHIKAKANEMIPTLPATDPVTLMPYDADLKDAVDA